MTFSTTSIPPEWLYEQKGISSKAEPIEYGRDPIAYVM
jgi:hypothetical protein